MKARLAILVVYVVRGDEDEALLQLHLDRIARHTKTGYRLYAATPRVTERGRQILAARPEVMLCDTGQCPAFGSREHAHHLDALVEHALEDGADALLTLDLDSFPISDTWLETISRVAPKQSGIAGILRAENGDTVLPHPSCLLVPAEFASRHRFSFSPDTDGSKEFRRFLRTRKQAADTGIRLAQILDQHDLPWGKLLRTNVRDLHPLIAGIYADSVFHLGAGSHAGLFVATFRLQRCTGSRDRSNGFQFPGRRDGQATGWWHGSGAVPSKGSSPRTRSPPIKPARG